MINIKNRDSIKKMEFAGQIIAKILDDIESIIVSDISTSDIDSWIDDRLKNSGLLSATKGYMGYKHASCISLNDEVVHGVPIKSKILKTGDLVKIDVCASWKGYCADMARCFFVGNISSEVKKLIDVAKASLDIGISKACVGNRLSDISAAIQSEVESHGFGVVRDFAGHGIGAKMHEFPEILNYGEPGKGPILRSGMTFAIEPMITMGSYEVYVDCDGWTVKTKDQSLAAHVEDTVLITDNGPRILTRLNDFKEIL